MPRVQGQCGGGDAAPPESLASGPSGERGNAICLCKTFSTLSPPLLPMGR